MLKQTIQFTDYNDQPREITEYFHLNEAEIVDMQAKSVNGIQADMQDAILSNDAGRVLDFIKELVHRSYGKKSADGLTFDKSPELLQRFINSAHYSDFLLGLIQDDGRKGQDFVKGIMPAKLVERAMAQVQGQEAGEADRTIYAPDAREVFASAQAESSIQVQQNPEPESPRVPADQFEAFQKWQAQQEAALQAAVNTPSAPVSPDAFRVREVDPTIPRPPHEHLGNAQP